MAQSNGLNPAVPGKMTAQGFSTPTGAAMIKIVATNGTTPVDVFGTTNGFSGTVVAVKSIARDTTASNITLATNDGTIATIAKGVTAGAVVAGTVTGSAFSASGTMQVVSSGTGNSLVEVTFTV